MSLAPIPDLELEAFLSKVRESLLLLNSELGDSQEVVKFQSILALHCFTNEYIYHQNEKDTVEMQVLEAYEQGMNSLNSNDVLFAAKKFNEAEMLFPQSKWAPKSALMAAYSYYKQDYYGDAIAELERFLRVYPNHKNLSYAYYLFLLG